MPSTSSRNQGLAIVVGTALVGLGLAAIVWAPGNNPLEGWGMLIRGLAGQALLVVGIDRLALAVLERPSPTARWVALLGTSVALFPLTVFILLLSRESGDSWAIAALILIAWFFIAGVFAAIKLLASRRRVA